MTDFPRWFLAAAALGLCGGLADAQTPYLISTYAGGLATPTAAAAVGYRFESPTAVATDPFGNTYISTSYHCIFRLSPAGSLSRVAGICQAGFSGDGGSAVNAQLSSPQGIALDGVGNLYIADQGNQRIRKVTPSGIISTVAGNGTTGFAGDNGQAINAELNNPQAVAVDTAGNIYIADSGNSRVRRFTPGGNITTFAGTGVSSSTGDGGLAVDATFMSPVGLLADSTGNVYISDGPANRVRKVDSGGTITTVAGTGAQSFGGDGGKAVSAQVSNPQGLALDPQGNLYIADDGNFRVRQVNAAGIIHTFAGSSRFGDTGDGGPATSAALLGPVGVSTDHSGNLFIADLVGAVRAVNSGGNINTVAGGGSTPFPGIGDGGVAGLAQFAAPLGLARDSLGNLYVADFSGYRIRKISSSGKISTIAGNGTASDTGDGGPAISATVAPRVLALDTGGILYLGDSAVVRKIVGGTISRVAGNGVPGFFGDNGPATGANLGGVIGGLAVDSHGNIYLSDFNNQRVRMVASSNKFISTVVGNGTPGFAGDGGLAVSAELQSPAGLALDASGNLYIADFLNCRVRRVAAVGGVITSASTISTVAGNGTCGTTGDSGLATSAEITNPWAVAVDAGGNLFIGTAGNTIRKVSGGIITTIAGTGVDGYSGDGGPATAAQFSAPQALALDTAGNVYFSDLSNLAVRVLQPESEPLLQVTSTHTGIFGAGTSGTFSITVTDAPLAVVGIGTVTVEATLPASFTPVAMGGTGWACNITALPYTCQGAATNTSPISLTVNVPAAEPSQVTNQVSVSGGGALGSSSEDVAFIGSAVPILQILASHEGDFVAGQQATFRIDVANQISAADTSGTITVADTLPTGLSLVSLTGGGSWDCAGASCTNNAPLAGGAGYDPLIGTVNVAQNAPGSVINTATVSGGGSASATSHDTITVRSLAACEISHNNNVTVTDVQDIVNQGLGASARANDINSDGWVNVVDIQIVINAALGLGCTQ